ncbi:hypothetical protein ACFRI7_30985 [Streptomyces sp. NPDC056716]|uniref:hypothetical protein n=1 Tax=unclassified Streptomyces TaxID=2593676 RepID=UPI0036C4B441
MTWTRGTLTVLAVCVLLLTGSAGCESDGGQEGAADQPYPVGEVLDDTDSDGRHYRELDEGDAPEVDIEVQPVGDGEGWEVRLTVEHFTFSPFGTRAEAVAGRGVARLFIDGRPVVDLHTPSHRLAADLMGRGTHQVTVRLYADDGTVWAADGEPVESTADITVSEPGPGASALSAPDPSVSAAVSASVPASVSAPAPAGASGPSVSGPSASIPSVSGPSASAVVPVPAG